MKLGCSTLHCPNVVLESNDNISFNGIALCNLCYVKNRDKLREIMGFD